jgi:hypothetical protein
MNRIQYLNNADVSDFVDWLSENLGNQDLTHQYTLPGGTLVQFTGLVDALHKYDWPFGFVDPSDLRHAGNTYNENYSALHVLRSGLNSALAAGNDLDATAWAIAVMNWGGVRNGNVTWLNSNLRGLASEISSVKNILSANDDDMARLGSIRRFNAGMTKVYSLTLEQFVIYDSRVAAALAWLVIKWCQNTKRAVPDNLRFACMPAKEGKNPSRRKVRNPSCGTYLFPWMNNRSVRHAHWNLRANWVLAETLSRAGTNTDFHKTQEPLRALEAALFMWGYDLSMSPLCGEAVNVDIDVNIEIEDGLANLVHDTLWLEAKTRAKSKDFKWCFDPGQDAIAIVRDNGTQELFKTSEVFAILHEIYDCFGYDCFPLANNVETMPLGTEKMGLGTIIYGAVKIVSHAQAASQLGVILERIGVVEYCQSTRGWRIKIELPFTIDDLRMMLGAPQL